MCGWICRRRSEPKLQVSYLTFWIIAHRLWIESEVVFPPTWTTVHHTGDMNVDERDHKRIVIDILLDMCDFHITRRPSNGFVFIPLAIDI